MVGLPNSSYKPITNTTWVHARLCKLQKRVHSQPQVKKFTSCLPMVGGSLPGTPASSTTKTGRHDVAEILLKVTLNTIKINQYKLIPQSLPRWTYSYRNIQHDWKIYPSPTSFNIDIQLFKTTRRDNVFIAI